MLGDILVRVICPNITLSKRYDLQVDYPPKTAICTWADDRNPKTFQATLEGLSPLECTAEKGHPSGGIICYVRSDYETAVYSPVRLQSHSAKKLYGRFWLRRDFSIRCCSQSIYFLKKYHKCTDFVSRGEQVKTTEAESLIDNATTSVATLRIEITNYLQDTPASCGPFNYLHASCYVLWLLSLVG